MSYQPLKSQPPDGSLNNAELMKWDPEPSDDEGTQEQRAEKHDAEWNALLIKPLNQVPNSFISKLESFIPSFGFGHTSLAPPDATVLQAINYAAKNVGIDPATFYCLIKQESGFRTSVKASTSSACGLCQFVDATWIATMRKHGAECGLDMQGKSTEQILALRNDPRVSTMMGAYFARDNMEYLRGHGVAVNSTTLYLAHFLGAGGAVALMDNLGQSAASVKGLSAAAGANQSIFYDHGRARTGQEIYDHFRYGAFSDQNMEVATNALSGGNSNVQVASNDKTAPTGAPLHLDHKKLANDKVAPAGKTVVASTAPIPVHQEAPV